MGGDWGWNGGVGIERKRKDGKIAREVFEIGLRIQKIYTGVYGEGGVPKGENKGEAGVKTV